MLWLAAGDPRIKAGYGIDPVDNTDMTPVSLRYPSAVAALNGTGLPMGVTGASRSTRCNPASANYQVRGMIPRNPNAAFQIIVACGRSY